MADFRARSTSEILDASFEIYRRHFAVFFAIGLGIGIPLALGTIVASLGAGQSGNGRLAVLAFQLVAGLFTPLVEAAIVAAAAAAYVGDPVDLGSAIVSGCSRPFTILLVLFFKWLVVDLGLILFIVPGAIALAAYFAAVPALVVEKRELDALDRSRHLSKGYRWRIFWLLALSVISLWIFVAILGGIGMAIFTGLHQPLIGAVLYVPILAALFPIISIITTVLYFDLRIRKEGYDIELMAGSLDTAPALQPAPAL